MDNCGQLHATAALTLGKELSVLPAEKEAGRYPQLVRVLWSTKKSRAVAGNRTNLSRLIFPCLVHYTG